MALGVAIAIAAGALNNVRRGPNRLREGCVSGEDDFHALRLRQAEVHAVAKEYVQWRRQDGTNVKYHSGERRVKVFLHYLAKGGYYRQLGRAEGLSESATMVHLHNVAAFFQETAAR